MLVPQPANVTTPTQRPTRTIQYRDVDVYRRKYAKFLVTDTTTETYQNSSSLLPYQSVQLVDLQQSRSGCKQDIWDLGHTTLRLAILSLTVVILTVHVRSLRVFRWEQSFSGGVFVSYSLIAFGLSICSSVVECKGHWLQIYYASSGVFMYLLNAFMMLYRWKSSHQMTRVVSELLVTLGLQIRNLMILKIGLSITCAVALLFDVALLAKEQALL